MATKNKALTPLAVVKQAFDDAPNAIEFCNWYMMNRPTLEMHELQLIDMAYQDGVNDRQQDADHVLKPGEYAKEIYTRDDN